MEFPFTPPAPTEPWYVKNKWVIVALLALCVLGLIMVTYKPQKPMTQEEVKQVVYNTLGEIQDDIERSEEQQQLHNFTPPPQPVPPPAPPPVMNITPPPPQLPPQLPPPQEQPPPPPPPVFNVENDGIQATPLTKRAPKQRFGDDVPVVAERPEL